MLVPHLSKIYFGPGWPSSVLEIVCVTKIKKTDKKPLLCCRNPLTVFKEKLEPKIVVIFLKTKISPFNIQKEV